MPSGAFADGDPVSKINSVSKALRRLGVAQLVETMGRRFESDLPAGANHWRKGRSNGREKSMSLDPLPRGRPRILSPSG